MRKGSENSSQAMMLVKTPCKLQGIMKKLSIEYKNTWEDRLWEAERKGKGMKCSSGGYFFPLRSLTPFWITEEFGVLVSSFRHAPGVLFSSPGGVPFSAARGRYGNTELGPQLQNWEDSAPVLGEWPGFNLVVRTRSNPHLSSPTPSNPWRNYGAEGQGGICTLHFSPCVFKSGAWVVEFWECFLRCAGKE